MTFAVTRQTGCGDFQITKVSWWRNIISTNISNDTDIPNILNDDIQRRWREYLKTKNPFCVNFHVNGIIMFSPIMFRRKYFLPFFIFSFFFLFFVTNHPPWRCEFASSLLKAIWRIFGDNFIDMAFHTRMGNTRWLFFFFFYTVILKLFVT